MTSQRQTQSKMAARSRQYFGFRSSRAATALHVPKKNFFYALIKVSTFICKREISGFSSPLTFFISSCVALPRPYRDFQQTRTDTVVKTYTFNI